jgi:hypothetical protein
VPRWERAMMKISNAIRAERWCQSCILNFAWVNHNRYWFCLLSWVVHFWNAFYCRQCNSIKRRGKKFVEQLRGPINLDIPKKSRKIFLETNIVNHKLATMPRRVWIRVASKCDNVGLLLIQPYKSGFLWAVADIRSQFRNWMGENGSEDMRKSMKIWWISMGGFLRFVERLGVEDWKELLEVWRQWRPWEV